MTAGTQEPRLACIKTLDARIDVWVIVDEDGRELVFETPTPGIGHYPRTKKDPETGIDFIPRRAEEHTGLFFPLDAEFVRRAHEILAGPFPDRMKAAARRRLRAHRERLDTRETPYDLAVRRHRHQAGGAS